MGVENKQHWVTPVVDFLEDHPQVTDVILPAVGGIYISLLYHPVIIPALRNFIEQASTILQR